MIGIIGRLARAPGVLWQSVRANRWARTELVSVKARLQTEGSDVRAALPPQGSSPRGHRGLDRALGKVSPTCLERALVLQAWDAAYREPPEVVIGVRRNDKFEAHAWVEGFGDDPWFDETYKEISRFAWLGDRDRSQGAADCRTRPPERD